MTASLWVLVPAAGTGRRMGAGVPKQYLTIQGVSLLSLTLKRLHQAFPDARLKLALDPCDGHFEAAQMPFDDWQRTPGGDERFDSVSRALAAMSAQPEDLVVVHDAARPCVTVADLHRVVKAAQDAEAGALLAMPVADTMKRDDGTGACLGTVDRHRLWHALTPQCFRHGQLVQALRAVSQQGLQVTDEASAIERLGGQPRLVSGRRDNLKVTHPDDLALASAILDAQRASGIT